MSIVIETIGLHVQNMRTRFPFQYGIASLVALPHLFVRLRANIGGVKAEGLAADGLPPKWFTKDPETHFTEDLGDMLAVIRHAVEAALDRGESETVFEAWQKIHDAQEAWAKATPFPPLLWAFGVSLIERALIDAHCRCTGRTFAQSVGTNTLGIRLEAIHPELGESSPRDWLPQKPLRSIRVRHTVGLADPLTAGDIPEDERLDDGLPHSLEENIAAYALTHLKIKLSGDAERDLARLKCIRGLMGDGNSCAFTLDGNEQYTEVGPFRTLWESILSDTDMSDFMKGLIFVEQPLHRAVALNEEARHAMMDWASQPPMIIDESDETLTTFKDSVALGYRGVSSKACKGMIKALANLALCHKLSDAEGIPGRYVLTGEDLTNVPVIALNQDLAHLAALGVTHAERNGHHYVRGLDYLPDSERNACAERHAGLYERLEDGLVALAIHDGRIQVVSLQIPGLGVGVEVERDAMIPLDGWRPEDLQA